MRVPVAVNWRDWLARLPIDPAEFNRLGDEWRANARLRWGLLAIWALFLLYLVLVLADLAAERRSELAAVQSRLDRLEAIEAQDYWLERARSSRAALAELEAGFPEVPSSGRAEAQVRSALQDLIDASGEKKKLRLSMKEAESINDGKLWQVSGTIIGVVTGNTVRDLLANLEPSVTHGRIARLKLVRGHTPKKVRLETEVDYFFRAEQQ